MRFISAISYLFMHTSLFKNDFGGKATFRFKVSLTKIKLIKFQFDKKKPDMLI